MRSWSLFFSSLFASLISVMSIVIPFCLLLTFYHGDLFVDASARTSQRGIEVMIYLTPFLVICAFACFWMIFRYLEIPKRVADFKQFSKVNLTLGLAWFGLIIFVQFLDGRMSDFVETIVFFLVSFVLLSVPLWIGLLSGNFCYLKLLKYLKIKNKIKPIQVKYTDLKQTVLD